MELKLGAQLYTVREHTQTEEGVRESLRKVRDIGYRAVQVSGFGADVRPEVVRDAAQENGLTIAATHISFDRCLEDLAGVVRDHTLWGCAYVGIGMMPQRYWASEEGFLQFTKEASAVAKQLEAEGLHLIYHNHMMEFMRFHGRMGMQLLLEESDPALQFELDTYWVQCGGADVCDWIRNVAGRMDVVHFKDYKVATPFEQTMCEVGEGNLNWAKIIRTCQDTGVHWALVEQDRCDGDPFDALQLSLHNLQAYGLA